MQTGTCRSGDGRLHDVTQIAWTLPGSDVVHNIGPTVDRH